MSIFERKTIECDEDACFLKRLFTCFNDAGISYAVMRNYETLPYTTSGSDIDIIVAPEDKTRMQLSLCQAIKESGGIQIGCTETVGFLKVFALGRSVSNPGAWWGQCVDVNIGLFFKAQPLLDMEILPSLTLRHNGISVLPNGLAGVLGVLKEVLNNDLLPLRYRSTAKIAAEQEWGSIVVALQPMGREALGLLYRMIFSYVSDDDVTLQCRQLRTALIAHAIRWHPLEFLWQRFLVCWSKIKRYLSPSGAVIAILGVDGAGKSTVVHGIKPVLEAATHNATFVQHLRPGLLPPLSRLKGKGEATSGPVLDPHGSTPSGILGSFLRLTYLTLDYILGYWLCTRPKIAKQPAIVLFDRYAYDMALDPRRFRIGLPGWMAEIFARFVPRPDLIICLHADPEIIAARKQELPLEETRRQVEALRSFAKTQLNAVLISTEGSIEEVRERVLGVLFDFFGKRKGS